MAEWSVNHRLFKMKLEKSQTLKTNNIIPKCIKTLLELYNYGFGGVIFLLGMPPE